MIIRQASSSSASSHASAVRCGLEPEFLDGAFARVSPPAVRVAFRSGQEIFGQGEPAEYVYRVLKGAVRCFRLLSDGRRQICEFQLEGDFLGLEAGIEHRATAEAMSDCVLLAVRRNALADLAAKEQGLSGELWRLAVRGHQRSQDHAMIVARQGATERVAAFLVEFATRVQAGDQIDLPMSRQDIADHLGLTIHTVSRTFSQLQGLDLIEVASPRRVRLKNLAVLSNLCS